MFAYVDDDRKYKNASLLDGLFYPFLFFFQLIKCYLNVSHSPIVVESDFICVE
jgi:hypothetical protein